MGIEAGPEESGQLSVDERLSLMGTPDSVIAAWNELAIGDVQDGRQKLIDTHVYSEEEVDAIISMIKFPEV